MAASVRLAMDLQFLLFVLIGFFAQMIDGALGMAYGVFSSSALLAMGVPPVTVSASVHAAEVVTTAFSGLSHTALKNIDRRLLWRLALSGSIGGGIGALMLVAFQSEILRQIIAAYLFLMGGLILRRSVRRREDGASIRHVAPLGFVGGFLDAIGGGGWGPVVASNLLLRGHGAREVIGSTNTAEFFVTVVIAATLAGFTGLSVAPMVLGLLLGGLLAAPVAALLARRLPHLLLMRAVGVLIMAISAFTLIASFST